MVLRATSTSDSDGGGLSVLEVPVAMAGTAAGVISKKINDFLVVFGF
jgi:hypothetical protein